MKELINFLERCLEHSCNEPDLQSGFRNDEESPMIAAISPPKSFQVQESQSIMVPIGDVVTRICELTGQDADSATNSILASSKVVFRDGAYFCQADAAIAAIDNWRAEQVALISERANSLKESLLSVEPEMNGNNGTATAVAEKPKAKREKEVKGTRLVLPPKFEATITKQYKHALSHVLPTKADRRQQYLDEIINQTDAGRGFLLRMAKAISTKHRNTPTTEKAMEGLLKAAKELASPPQE